jgi:hypothetical protein
MASNVRKRSRVVRSLQIAAVLLVAGSCARALAAEGPHADAVHRGAAAFQTLERAEIQKLSQALDALSSDPAILKLFQARKRDALLALAAPKFQRLKARQGITHWYFLEPEPVRTVFLRVHTPELYGDYVNRDTFSQAIANHRMGYGKELGKTAFALRVVKPIRVDGRIIGYMEIGEEIDDFLARMKKRTGDDFGLLVDKDRVDRKELARVLKEDRWDERPDVVLVNSTMWNEQMIQLRMPLEKIPADGVVLGEWTDGASRFLGGAFPVHDAAGKTVGALIVRHSLGR